MSQVGSQLFIAFEGTQAPPEVLHRIQAWEVAGVTLYRALNVRDPAQVRELTRALQSAARTAGQSCLLIAIDQEGGQLMGVGEGTTPLPGNMALGAAGSPSLARRAGEVLGRELAAMGINVNYAPVCDVNVNPHNPVIGTRSFGQDPRQVARLAAAMIEGIQSAGVAATAKHFPGHGDTATDSHYGTPTVPHDVYRLEAVELVPFVAAIEAGVQLIMTAHVAVPSVTGAEELPATLSSAVLEGLLRRRCGFEGVIITDAMDMGAIQQGCGLAVDALCASLAGADLLLLGPRSQDQVVVRDALLQAVRRGLLPSRRVAEAAERVRRLKAWVAQRPSAPPLDVVGCAEHMAVADEIAARAVTLVRDHARLLPLRLPADARVGVVMPKPADLTPADTSSYVPPLLGEAIRRYHPRVEEYIVPFEPNESHIAALVEIADQHDVWIVGTLNAFDQPAQADLVRALCRTGVPLVVAALRLPYDLHAFPEVSTYVCTYSVQPPALNALAAALFGHHPFKGHLPVSIPSLYPVGHGEGVVSV